MAYYDRLVNLRLFFTKNPNVFISDVGTFPFECVTVHKRQLQNILMKSFMIKDKPQIFKEENNESYISFEYTACKWHTFLDSILVRHGAFYFTTITIISKLLVTFFLSEVTSAKYTIKACDENTIHLYNCTIFTQNMNIRKDINEALTNNPNYVKDIYDEWRGLTLRSQYGS